MAVDVQAQETSIVPRVYVPEANDIHDRDAPTISELPGSDATEKSPNTSQRSDVPQEKLEQLESRPRHRYIIRRPRALQYTYHHQVVRAGEEETAQELDQILSGTQDASNGSATQSAGQSTHHLHNAIEKQREHLDLFIDLIWVGIISNISEVYSNELFNEAGSHPGRAALFFFVSFLPTWRIWNGLREFVNDYYMDDILQRTFLFWLLILSVFYGNNLAYLTERTEWAKVLCISIYLCVRASLLIIGSVYSIFIPWLRKRAFVTVLLYLPSIGLWFAGIYVYGLKAIGPIIGAIVCDYSVPLVLERLLGKLVPSKYGKAVDHHHFTSRMANFFIITLGEGVLQLVRDGPLGLGIQRAAALSVWSLMIYFFLVLIYFNKDSSPLFIPALVRQGWRTFAWTSWHIPIFMSTITLSAGIMFIIRQAAPESASTTGDPKISGKELPAYVGHAVWTVACSLSLLILSMTGLALLDESVSPPKSLRVSNRYVRLSGRLVYICIAMLVPLCKDLNSEVYLAVCALLLMALSLWEWIVSTDKDGKIFEPKGGTGLVSRSNSA